MGIVIRKNARINNVDDWRREAPPVKPEQWKPGRSAMLLAQYATCPVFLDDLSRILGNEMDISSDPVAEPEYMTRLPNGNRTQGRHHDLLVIDRDAVICIEAKVSEPFGNGIIAKEYFNGSKNNPQNKKDRVDALLRYVGSDINAAGGYQYQLLTGLAGTLLEAAWRGMYRCMFLVLTFVGDVDIPASEISNVEANDNAFKAFCRDLLKIGNLGGMKDFDVDGQRITCLIRKVDIKVETDSGKPDGIPSFSPILQH